MHNPFILQSGIRSRSPLPAKPSAVRVLVVDDDPDIAQLLASLLARNGFGVEALTAGGGDEGEQNSSQLSLIAELEGRRAVDRHDVELLRFAQQLVGKQQSWHRLRNTIECG